MAKDFKLQSVSLRMPKGLHEVIRKEAETSRRSLNQQIVHLLESATALPKAVLE